MSENTCYHCGLDCGKNPVYFNDKCFCCNGCKTVYEILNQNELSCYYDLEQTPGNIPKEIQGKFDYLKDPEIEKKILEFTDGTTSIVEFYIPSIHCSACIWVLENLEKLNPAINTSLVNFPNKTVRINFKSKETNLKEIVELLTSIAYEPFISLDDAERNTKKVDKTLITQLGVAAFGFGNIMILAFPEYFESNEYWLENYKFLFRSMMLFLSIPVVVYAAKDYFITAVKGLVNKIISVDIPIALGITALFTRSVYEVLTDIGPGYFDSLTGLIFFLLVGKFFQQKTYNFLSFERDYRSYFPIAVTRIKGDKEETVQVQEIEEGDRLLIRNEELIPVDAILIHGEGYIDYSFVTGESAPVLRENGEKVFAGGKQMGGAIEIDVINKISESYLTELWSNDIFNKDEKEKDIKSMTDTISKYFTVVILTIAIIASAFWVPKGFGIAAEVFTAVLIIACPCALALSAPFAMGNMLRIFGYKRFYLKNDSIIEKLNKIDHIVFDKTGTITTTQETEMEFEGKKLNENELRAVKSVIRSSNHPLSRALNEHIDISPYQEPVTNYKEITGKGIEGQIKDYFVQVGSAKMVGEVNIKNESKSIIYIKINDEIKGFYKNKNIYRKNVEQVFKELANHYEMSLISGDHEGEAKNLEKILPEGTVLLFNKSPQNKLDYVKKLQNEGKHILMVGDGLNDAGALAQSHVGIAISEDINVFSPACDGILDAKLFNKLPYFLKLSRQTVNVIKWSFVFSFLYNIIGMYFAVTAQLTPLVAAILMPLSSISIVVFVSVMTNIIGYKK